jgi:3-dehydroquinate synthase
MLQQQRSQSFEVRTAQAVYPSVVERAVLARASEFIPAKTGKRFIVSERHVWKMQQHKLDPRLTSAAHVLFFPGGEPNKRLAAVEALANEMLSLGGDRTSLVIGFGGGIVTDVAGFLAAIFMRGVPVLQIPTTLLAQVDAAVGGKTGVNLVGGKNLIGSFHQPSAVLIDPDVLATLPEREYRAGLFEVVKCGIIRDRGLFEMLEKHSDAVLAKEPEIVETLIAAAVRIKAEVVSADEREGDLRRILNFGHTVGHAIEAETHYEEFLHGEAIAWGMRAAIRLAGRTGHLDSQTAERMERVISLYGPVPSASHLDPDHLLARLASDKKTLQGKVHFVLPVRVGEVKIVSGIDPELVRGAIAEALR